MSDDRVPEDVVAALGRVARQLMELVMEQREEIKALQEQNGKIAAEVIEQFARAQASTPRPS
jgi:hypothetical protein